MNNQVQITFDYSDLSSRGFATTKREEVKNILQSNKNIKFDLTNVESISPSFADELFAILFCELGKNVFEERISFITNKESIIESISTAIKNRDQRMVLA